MITGPQCRAARALVELSREKVAKLSGIDVDVIAKFENQIDVPQADVVERLKDMLEQAGAASRDAGDIGLWQNVLADGTVLSVVGSADLFSGLDSLL